MNRAPVIRTSSHVSNARSVLTEVYPLVHHPELVRAKLRVDRELIDRVLVVLNRFDIDIDIDIDIDSVGPGLIDEVFAALNGASGGVE
jgi:hypothetical protein